jgi:hypothetical protein
MVEIEDQMNFKLTVVNLKKHREGMLASTGLPVSSVITLLWPETPTAVRG